MTAMIVNSHISQAGISFLVQRKIHLLTALGNGSVNCLRLWQKWFILTEGSLSRTSLKQASQSHASKDQIIISKGSANGFVMNIIVLPS